MTRRLVVVSNRAPVTYGLDDAGVRTTRRGGGGLIAALAGLVSEHDVTWVASAISDEDRRVAATGGIEEHDRAGSTFRLRLVAHEPYIYDRFYNVVSNPLLWFVHHRLWPLADRPVIDRATRNAWRAYEAVNANLARAAADECRVIGDSVIVLLHDYQLYAAGPVLRAALPGVTMSHFVHVPFPDPSAWRVLPRPMRESVVAGLLASDIVGFHTDGDAEGFLRLCAEHGREADLETREVACGQRTVRVRAYPISIDPQDVIALAALPETVATAAELARERTERVVLHVARTDPSKNVVRGLLAFDRFLDQHEEWRGRVSLLLLLDPSRLEIPEYAEYLAAILRTAREIGDRWPLPDGRPAVDLRIRDSLSEAIAGYVHYDVLLVNPLFDGMNLVAKEAPLVNERDGVVILSENAGAHAELRPYVLTVNPFDVQEQADAIALALSLPAEERARRAEGLREHVREHDVRRWLSLQLAELDSVGPLR